MSTSVVMILVAMASDVDFIMGGRGGPVFVTVQGIRRHVSVLRTVLLFIIIYFDDTRGLEL